MKTLKSMNFGGKGWLLMAYQFLAYVAFTVFTNWPMNILADMYGGAAKLSTLYTVGICIAIVVQLILASFIGRIKSMKMFGCVIGIVAMFFSFLVMVIPPTMLGLWQGCYFLNCIFVPMWATYSVNVLVGQWFPTKKGTFMGIATLAFPIVNGMQGFFAHAVFGAGVPNVFGSMMPYWIICLIGLIIGLAAIKDYPEQCGAYRDNNKDMTPEIANAMMAQEIENKKTSVWKTGSTLATRDFWLITLPMGALLMCSVGMMTQTASIIGSFGAAMDPYGGFTGIMVMNMIFGIIGSFVIGLIDTAIGTKKAVLLSCVVMLISGILGTLGSAPAMVASLILLAIFMGASSNFLVSASAQYWRREDFSSVFSCVSPVANILQCAGPMIIAILFATRGVTGVFTMVTVAGILSIIFTILFSPKHVKAVDDKRRAKAGKTVDDELVGRQ